MKNDLRNMTNASEAFEGVTTTSDQNFFSKVYFLKSKI
ncbi:MAG: hypothetical protein ACI9Z3_000273 [Roseivirga sp.]|jgi:hypothetical protein